MKKKLHIFKADLQFFRLLKSLIPEGAKTQKKVTSVKVFAVLN